jgi:PAS domain S-box-containing protein
MALPDAPAAMLAAIIASSDDAIISKDLNGIVTSWNQGAERLFGYTAEEMLGQSIARIIPLERRAEEDLVLSSIRAGKTVDHFETVRQRKDGSFVNISLTVSPIVQQDGRIIGASKIARDITDRKRAEHHEFRLAAIVESSDDAIVGKDLQGTVQSWNAGAERMFGYSAAEMIGQPVMVIVPADRADEELSVLTRIRAGEKVGHFETVRCHKNGRRIDVSVSVSPILAKDGTIVGASKIARDITAEKRLRRAAEEASRAKDEFLATLSHELRTPLNAVLGYTHMLQKGAVASPDLPKVLETISRNAEALTRLVNDVLDASRIVSGRIRLTLQSCDIGAIAEEAVSAVKPAVEAKRIALKADIDRGLWVRCDPDRLQQVLWNLLTNAVKFTDEGGTVRVTAALHGVNVRISIEDSGIGIAPESLPLVFQRFWQADSSHARSRGGLGLGLALAQTLVELHGGRITAASEGTGRGATFEVVLPAAPAAV